MKNLLFSFFGILLLCSSCGKYEDGPGFSMRSKTERLSNKWVYDKSYRNGEELIYGIGDYNYFEIKKNGDYILNINIDSENTKDYVGTWEFMDKKESVRINSPSYEYRGKKHDEYTFTMKIDRLKEDELWLSQGDNDNTVSHHYIPK